MTYAEQVDLIVAEVSAKHDAALAKFAPDSVTPDLDRFDIAFAAYESECWQRIAEIDTDNEIIQMVASAKEREP